MKRFLFVIVFAAVAAGAKCQDKVYVHLSNGTAYQFNVDDCTDIDFEPGTSVVVNTLSGDMVDLGLSVKWASCNLGAHSPAEFGNYYAWGDVAPKDTYADENAPLRGLSLAAMQERGVIDADGNLTRQYDAAAHSLGEGWRMPTSAEVVELFTECQWVWSSNYNGTGVSGHIVTGPNGNHIFLPAAGCRYAKSLYGVGEFGGYWAATAIDDSEHAFGLNFYPGSIDWNDYSQSHGQAVRAVCCK